jgi:hypothetical protein
MISNSQFISFDADFRNLATTATTAGHSCAEKDEAVLVKNRGLPGIGHEKNF